MASKHILSLEIPTVSNCDLLCIKDTSQYSSELAVDCEELLITLPGFSVPVLIDVDKSFDMCLTACTLSLQKENCGTVQDKIPDGIYIIKYSVSPNSKVYVEYNSEKQALLAEMSYIKTIIDAAIANVEYCQSSAHGMQLYNYAKTRLNKISCPSGNCGSSSTYLV